MATESSAIERFIELQQRERIHGTGEPLPSDPTDPFTPVESRRTPLIIVLAFLGAGAAIAAGVLGAKTRFWAADAPAGAAGAESRAAAAPGLPSPEPKAAAAPADEADEAGEPAAPTEEAHEPEPDPDTGFDLRVEPKGARVLLDGEELGEAPLRVRNLAPGQHSIQVTAPEGYFSKHVEVELERGEPQELRVELEPVEEELVIEPLEGEEHAAAGDAERAERKPSRAEARQERRRARRARHERRRARRRAEPSADRARSARAGVLRLGSKPPMEIYIDGKKTGLKTPQRSIDLSPGKHRIVLINREFGLKDRFNVRIAPKKTTTVLRDLSDRL